MRALVVTALVVASFAQHPVLAQNQGKAPLGESQPVQAQGGPNVPTLPDTTSSSEANRERMMERLGPGMDWDHRKPGHDLQMAPRSQGEDVKRDRD